MPPLLPPSDGKRAGHHIDGISCRRVCRNPASGDRADGSLPRYVRSNSHADFPRPISLGSSTSAANAFPPRALHRVRLEVELGPGSITIVSSEHCGASGTVPSGCVFLSPGSATALRRSSGRCTGRTAISPSLSTTALRRIAPSMSYSPRWIVIRLASSGLSSPEPCRELQRRSCSSAPARLGFKLSRRGHRLPGRG